MIALTEMIKKETISSTSTNTDQLPIYKIREVNGLVSTAVFRLDIV